MGDKIKVKSIDEGITPQKHVPINLMMKNRLGAKWFLIILFCLIFGGASGVFINNYLFPYLLVMPQFEKYKFLQPRQKNIIIKKETVKIDEENIIPDFAKKTRPYVAAIANASEAKSHLNRVQELKNYASGVILTNDGIIATSKSVVSKNRFYSVITHDGNIYETNKIYSDPASDLAFLKIDAKDLSAADLLNSDEVVLGQKVLTFKNLFLSSGVSVLSGAIENLNYNQNFEANAENLDTFITSNIDADVGSPIFNLNGRVIGIVIRKNNNEAMAINAADIKKPLTDLIKSDRIKRAGLGIKYLTITSDFADFKGFIRSRGIFLPQAAVSDAVAKKSPAERAGIKAGDIIFAINGKEITGEETYFRQIQQFNASDEVEISYLRNNQEYRTKAKLEERLP